MGVTWYRLKFQYGAVLGNVIPLVSITSSEPSPKTGKHTLRVVVPGATLKGAMQRCRILARNGFACGVETLPERMKIASAE